MVRYRPDVTERGYTFRLNSNSSLNGSPNGTLSDRNSTLDSTIYKERIDSLFRERHNREKDTVPIEEPTMEQLTSHFQKVLAEHRGTSSPSIISRNNSQNYIHIRNQPNKNATNGVTIINGDHHRKDGHYAKQSVYQVSTRSRSFNEARNAVQAQIEKMFQDASKISHDDVTVQSNKAVITIRSPAPALSAEAIQSKQSIPLPPIPKSTTVTTPTSAPPIPAAPVQNEEQQQRQQPERVSISLNKYKVDYLGCLALQERATSLESLQIPLKELYIKYRHSLANRLNVYRGTLDISTAGLRIQYYSDWRTTIPVEILNPFPTIAVWAAVKFVYRSETISRGTQERKFAFLPLICDPENQDKQNLFHPLQKTEYDVLASAPAHPPMFTCVMRKMGAPKILECHAFVCDNPEDAIVIAANLYQALLRNMKTEKSNSPVHNSNGIDSRPVNEMKASEPQYSPSSSVSNWSDSSMVSGVPVRPPRRKKKNSTLQDSDLGPERRRSVRRTNSKSRLIQGKPNLRRSMRSSSQRRIRRSVSERHLGTVLSDTDGDILTKVAIPRSKSFMTVPQSYSIGELFEELKKQEGIESIDDVLKMIVNRDRMSFNDLQPAYKELLMKLALTLSKDEMFQRSKNIMKNQRNKSKTNTKSRDSDAEHSSSSRISSVLRATKKSFSKWGGKSGSGYSVASKENKLRMESMKSNKSKFETPGFMPSDASPKSFAPKTPLPQRINNRNHSTNGVNAMKLGHGHGGGGCNECSYDSESCYSDKCYCSFNQPVSKASTDCETDCSESEKCYCSLKRVKNGSTPVYKINLDSDTDTISSHLTMEDTKHIYNKSKKSRPNYSRKTASLTSWTALSGAESPLTAWRRNTANIQNKNKTNSSNRFDGENAAALRKKSLSSYLSDTSLDSDIVAMTTPLKKMSGNNSFNKQGEALRQKSNSSYLCSESEQESVTTSCSSFVRGNAVGLGQINGRKASPDSVGYQSYDSSTSTVKTLRNAHSFSTENLASVTGRRNSNSSSDHSLKSASSGRGNKKVLMVSAVDPKGKIVYRGTSSTTHGQGRSQTSAPEGVLSVKKTAEIAALFSNLKLNQTTDIVIDHSGEDTESEVSADDAYSSMRYNKNKKGQNGFSTSLENSLGYLP